MGKQIIGLVIISAFLIGCAVAPRQSSASPAAKSRAEGRNFTLFAWDVGNGRYHFALIPDDQWESFLLQFHRDMPAITSVPALQRKLLTLPKAALIGWSDAEGFGIRYPSERVMNQVKKFAAINNIHLVIDPGVYE